MTGRKPTLPVGIDSIPRRFWPIFRRCLATREYTGQEEFDGEMELIGRRLPYRPDRPEVALSPLAIAGLAMVSARLIETGGETLY